MIPTHVPEPSTNVMRPWWFLPIATTTQHHVDLQVFLTPATPVWFAMQIGKFILPQVHFRPCSWARRIISESKYSTVPSSASVLGGSCDSKLFSKKTDVDRHSKTHTHTWHWQRLLCNMSFAKLFVRFTIQSGHFETFTRGQQKKTRCTIWYLVCFRLSSILTTFLNTCVN